ncbi:flagellar basal-body rod protein FlgF [Amphibiibacter pelophylacis]|uniref:Flagellar basal-body rod protein FlgF n=1 Tax=Amphibiibacter pelophylacis TaxID=1799477 RepID=A0ACC6P0W6_9BURK
MDRMIYTAMTGAKAMMQRQETLTHNLANATSTGFRAELVAFRAVPVNGSGASTRVMTLESTTGYDAKPGPMRSTGNPLDVGLAGNAWLAVQSLQGTEAYTRAGSLAVNAEGTLMTHNGLPVQGDGGPIVVPGGAQPRISPDGTVLAVSANGQATRVGKLKLVTPEAPLQRGEDGLFRAADGADLPADERARVLPETLEGSNVSTVETMVAMIAAAREFDTHIRLLQTAERNDQTAARLLGPA